MRAKTRHENPGRKRQNTTGAPATTRKQTAEKKVSASERKLTITITDTADLAEIHQDRAPQADEDLIAAYTEEYEERLRKLLPDVDLRFVWEMAEKTTPKVYCNCGSPPGQWLRTRGGTSSRALSLEETTAKSSSRPPWRRAETEEIDLRNTPLTKQLRAYIEWRKTQAEEHEGRWVIVHENGVIASQGSPETALHTARERGFTREDCLIVRAYPGQPAISTWGA